MNEYNAAALILTIVIFTASHLFLASKIQELYNIVKSGKIAPRNLNIAEGFELVVKAVKAVAPKRKLKNLGGDKTIPDIMPQLEKNFAAWIKKRANSEAGLDFREKSMEPLMSEFGCPNLNTLRTLLQRFEGLGILEKRGTAGNSTRKLARDGYTKIKEMEK